MAIQEFQLELLLLTYANPPDQSALEASDVLSQGPVVPDETLVLPTDTS